MTHDPTLNRRIPLARTMLTSLEELLRELITDPDSKTNWQEIQSYQHVFDAANALILNGERMSVDSALANYERLAYDDDRAKYVKEHRKKVAHYLDVLRSLHMDKDAG